MAIDTTVGGTAADSYGTLADWLTYILNQKNVDLSADGDTAAKHESDLRQAAAAIDRNWTYKGIRADSTQALQWPRTITDLIDGFSVANDSIPQAIINAQFELAYLIHEGLDPFATVSGGAIKREFAKAGPVETETEYMDGGRELPRLVAVEGLLKPYVVSGLSATVKQVRFARG